MRSKKSILGLMGLAALTAAPTWAQRPFYLVPGLHPGYSLVSMRPTASNLPETAPNVGAMAWLPGGRLFIASMSPNPAGGATANLLGPSDGYIFSGIPGATSKSAVTVTVAGGGYQMPAGAVALGDTIYVVDNENGLTKLTPGTGGTYTKSTVYSGLLGRLSGKSGNSHRTWVGGLVHKDGFFYATVGMGLIPGGTSEMVDANLYRGKSTI